MLKIAVTGGIACGKSLVGDLLAEAGIPVCEADDLARELLEPGLDCYEKVVEFFGSGVVREDGAVNRAALGRRVFACEDERRALNAILHPPVKAAWERWLAGLGDDVKAAAVIVPLLFEEGMDAGWDRVVTVTCSKDKQVERLEGRGLSRGDAEKRLAAQWDVGRKVDLADFVIVNNGSTETLKKQVKRVLQCALERRHHDTKKQ